MLMAAIGAEAGLRVRESVDSAARPARRNMGGRSGGEAEPEGRGQGGAGQYEAWGVG